MNTLRIYIVGVGGQGNVLASKMIGEAALSMGVPVLMSETHGMAQRGGAVTTVVRFGEEVCSMVADLGSADCVVSFETTEALRNLPYLKEGGNLLVADETIKPLPVQTGRASMPADARGQLRDLGATLIPAGSLALEIGSPKSVNVVLLGALVKAMGLEDLDWKAVLSETVPPKLLELNIRAFEAGLAQ